MRNPLGLHKGKMKSGICIRRKFLLLLFACITVKTARAQEITWQQKFDAIKAVDSIVNAYQNYLTFTDMEDIRVISDKTIHAFRNLFTAKANVFDDLCPSFFDGNMDQKLLFTEKPVDEFLSKVKEVYPKGLDYVEITNINAGYNDLKDHLVYVALEKIIKGQTKDAELEPGQYPGNKWKVEIKDTVILTINLSSNFTTAIIQEISHANTGAPSFRIMNDLEDGDFVADEVDKCRTVKGLLSNHGCPEARGAFLTFLGSFSIGYSPDRYNHPQSPTINVNYDNTIYESKIGLAPDLSVSGEFEAFLGTKRHYGVGLGIMYNQIESSIEIPRFNTMFSDTDNFNLTYERRISNYSSSIKENLSFGYLLIPGYFKYKTFLGSSSKLGIKLNVGAAISLPLPALTIITPDGGNSFNYEARYSVIGNSIEYNSETSDSDVLWTREHISHNPDSVFYSLDQSGYDLGDNKPIERINTKRFVNIRPGYAIILKPSLTYLLRRDAYLNFGLELIYEHHRNRAFDQAGYYLTNEVGEYNTLLGGAKDYNHFFIGLNAGVSFNLIRKREKKVY